MVLHSKCSGSDPQRHRHSWYVDHLVIRDITDCTGRMWPWFCDHLAHSAQLWDQKGHEFTRYSFLQSNVRPVTDGMRLIVTHHTSESHLLLNTNSAIASLRSASPGILALYKFDWLIDWLMKTGGVCLIPHFRENVKGFYSLIWFISGILTIKQKQAMVFISK